MMRALRNMTLAGCMAAAVLLAPHQARAQCEIPTSPATAASGVVIPAQTAAVSAMTTAITAAVETSTSIARAAMTSGLEVGWLALRDRLNQFWQDQQEAMQGQAAQLSAATLDQTRQLGSAADASVASAAARTIQKLEFDARRKYVPTDEGCRFDTTGPYLGRAISVSRGVASAGTGEIIGDMDGQEGRPAAQGAAADFAARARQNRSLFCNPLANGDQALCAEDAGEFADAHVLPSRSLLGSDTYDVTDPRTVPAINELVKNLSGYRPATPVSRREMGSASQRESRMEDRAVQAQTDAAAGMLWGIAGERMPAGEAPEIEEMRLRLGGSRPSSSPSEYEIGQQIVEQLWDPAYYANLQDAPGATAQKQIYLRAYAVMQLYKLIEKTERLANVYAIQTANMIERTGRGRGGVSGGAGRSSAPTPPAAEE